MEPLSPHSFRGGIDPILDNEAVRVVEMSPEWTPGKSDGKPVSVSYTFPVIFKLR